MMKTQITSQKQELINWIQTIDDTELLNELINLKQSAVFDFDKEFEKAISGEELKIRVSKQISSLPWKK